jgi:hypothetical protein
MRKLTITLAVLFLFGPGAVVGRADKPNQPVFHQINVCVRQGDPQGSREAGTVSTVAQPRMVVVDKQQATFITGDGVEVENKLLELRITPALEQDGSVRLSVDMMQKEVVYRDGDDVCYRIHQSRYTRMVQLDEVIRLHAGKMGDTQTWVELSVTEFKR